MANPVLTARELMLEIKNYGIVLDIMYLVLLTPAKPEDESGTLFRQPQLDRETRSQTGHPAFKEYPTRLLVFS